MHTERRSFSWIGLLFAALLVIPAGAQAASQNATDGEAITLGHRYQIESKILGETRKYIVHKPVGYDFSTDAYPVVILLDGDSLMQSVSASVDFLTTNGRSMAMLIVGIENTDRQRDLTPPITSAQPDFVPPGNVGGAQKFLSFIADELLPHVDRTYRTRPTRILIGHSYGGLFAVYTLFNRPELFKAYIAVSPALAWDNQALAKQADQFVANHKDLQTVVYMTMANEGGATLGGAQKVIGSLASSPGNFSVKFQHWPEESHGSVVMPSVYEGMEWLHQFYYTTDLFMAYEDGGLGYFDKRFALISKYLGYEVKVPEQVLMNLQRGLIHMQRPAEAQKVLQRVLELYPNSPQAHHDLAKAYLATDDNALAEQALRRTLESYPGHRDARDAVEKMGVDLRTVVVEGKPTPAVLRDYVGAYRYSDETLRVALEGGKLVVHAGNDPHELRSRTDGSFYAVGWDREFTFRKKSGRTTAMTVHMPEFTYESAKVQ